ncbi:IclR family transcriptional regulator [Halobellus sp. Atlit-38R]|uniref:IclR family transcriptional regulator n=1 Tax=Halobellus sp. Atlit-38R TaxID=2282131 RepID=UPI001F20D4B0|nr:IclR family transcriptional regulator [Halobellus sp. Atlit-38R]
MGTVTTSWEIIHALEELRGAGVTELADHLEMPKGTVYTHLATLKEQKYVVKRDGKYHLSLHFLSLGEFVKNNHFLFNAGRSEVERLADETDEYVHLVTEEHGDLIYLHEARGQNAVGKNYFEKKLEKPGYLHSSAYGKAILAYLPESYVEEIVDQSGLPQRTEKTITSKTELFDELETIREQGFAQNDEEEIFGTRAVGAPILDKNNTVLGAVSITKPTSRMQGEEFNRTIPEVVKNAANVIEVNIQTIRNQDINHHR